MAVYTLEFLNPEHSLVIYCGTGCIRPDCPPPAGKLLRSVARLDVVHGYACGGLGRVPCQDGLRPAQGGLQRLVTKTYQ